MTTPAELAIETDARRAWALIAFMVEHEERVTGPDGITQRQYKDGEGRAVFRATELHNQLFPASAGFGGYYYSALISSLPEYVAMARQVDRLTDWFRVLMLAWTERIKHRHSRPDDGFAQILVNYCNYRSTRIPSVFVIRAIRVISGQRIWAGSLLAIAIPGEHDSQARGRGAPGPGRRYWQLQARR